MGAPYAHLHWHAIVCPTLTETKRSSRSDLWEGHSNSSVVVLVLYPQTSILVVTNGAVWLRSSGHSTGSLGNKHIESFAVSVWYIVQQRSAHHPDKRYIGHKERIQCPSPCGPPIVAFA